MLRLAVCTSLFALICASPASAERWQDRVDNNRIKTRLDLDGFRRNGDLLTYRMEIVTKATPDHATRKVISTSVIDCHTGMRKHLAIETYRQNGSVQKTEGANRWTTLKDWEFGAGVRNDYCDKAN